MVDATHAAAFPPVGGVIPPRAEKGGEILDILSSGGAPGGMHHGGTARNNPTASFALSDFPALGIRSDAAGPSSVPYGNGAIHQQRENYVMDKGRLSVARFVRRRWCAKSPAANTRFRKPLNRGLTTRDQMVCILQRVERMVFLVC